MDKHFLQRFMLHASDHQSSASDNADAAVLIPVVASEPKQLILTKRSAHLRHHPSQISFPGGKHDEEDEDLSATALREAFEEIGLESSLVKVHGTLPSQATVSQFHIHPFLATVSPDLSLVANEDEVAEIIILPLAPFLIRENYLSYRFKRRGQDHTVYFIQVEQQVIWGATARILYDFCLQCGPEQY